MRPVKSTSDTFTSDHSKPFEKTITADRGWSEVKLWQIAHRVKVGMRFYKWRPRGKGVYDEVWEIVSVEKRGVVIVLRGNEGHRGMIEWLGTTWIEGIAPLDISARTFERAMDWANIIRRDFSAE